LEVITNGGARAVDFLIFGLALFFCAGTLVAQLPHESPSLPPVGEEFDRGKQSIATLDAAVAYIRPLIRPSNPREEADAADELVRRRFYHSYSFFDPGENWLAYLAGFLWLDLRSPVRPDDILKHPQAACSQQVIVFDALAQRLGLETAVVALDHHMAAAVKLGGRWQVYDADTEIHPRSYPLSALLAADPAVLAIYGHLASTLDLAGQAARGRIRLIDINADPAPHAAIFDEVTAMLSDYAWAFFLALALIRVVPSISAGRRAAAHPPGARLSVD
jgi:hypothetical protein